MRFRSPLEAGKYADEKRVAAESLSLEKTVSDPRGPVPRDSRFYKEIFELQGVVEKGGSMDYHAFANRLWRTVTGSERLSENFQVFESRLISGLHAIPMRDMVYPHVIDAMPALISKYKDSIAHISLWSTGDVTATGYQVAKIRSSRIAERFMREIAEQTPEHQRRTFFEKTSYDVADQKFENIASYVHEKIEEGPLKIVVIEDSYGNFGKVEKAVRAAVGEERAKDVDIRKIWALYSREGTLAKNNAAKSAQATADLDKKLSEVKGIASFSELLSEERFGDDLRKASVFVDFDGVIGDNVKMRDVQAEVILSALTDGLSKEWKMDTNSTKEQIFARIAAEG